MNQKHVPSMELCQQFVDLCSKNNITLPETEFYWNVKSEKVTAKKYRYSYYSYLDEGSSEQEGRSQYKNIPAPLVSEQGEWLKFHSHKSIYGSKTGVAKNVWRWHFFADFDVPDLMADTEANARMMGLNYLLAEGIITTL